MYNVNPRPRLKIVPTEEELAFGPYARCLICTSSLPFKHSKFCFNCIKEYTGALSLCNNIGNLSLMEKRSTIGS